MSASVVRFEPRPGLEVFRVTTESYQLVQIGRFTHIGPDANGNPVVQCLDPSVMLEDIVTYAQGTVLFDWYCYLFARARGVTEADVAYFQEAGSACYEMALLAAGRDAICELGAPMVCREHRA